MRLFRVLNLLMIVLLLGVAAPKCAPKPPRKGVLVYDRMTLRKRLEASTVKLRIRTPVELVDPIHLDNPPTPSFEMSSCTGVSVRAPSGNTYVLSAAHCANADSGDEVVAVLPSGLQMPVKIVKRDPHVDLLLLEPVSVVPPVRIAKEAKRWEHVTVFGYGLHHPAYAWEGEVIVIAPSPFQEEADCLTLAVHVTRGQSGGPVVNDRMELVGIATGTRGDEESISYASSIPSIRSFLADR